MGNNCFTTSHDDAEDDIGYNKEYNIADDSAGYNVALQYHAPLYDAIYGCEVLEMLKNRQMDINAKNDYGQTVLHLVAGQIKIQFVMGHEEIPEKLVKLLIEQGARPNAQDNCGNTALHMAVARLLLKPMVSNLFNFSQPIYPVPQYHYEFNQCYINMIETLAEVCDVNITNSSGASPLHIAAESGSLKVVNTLLAVGAKVNIQDGEGNTPLHCIFLSKQNYFRRCKFIMRALLVKGARIDIENCKGVTVASLCLENLYKTRFDEDVIKLTEAGIKYYMNNDTDSVVHNTRSSESFARSCSKELARMKEKKMGSIFSEYKDPAYVANVELEELVACGDTVDQFPIYGILLRITYESAKRRKRLLDVLSYNFHFPANTEMPPEILRLILSQLSDKDLWNMLQASGLQEKKEV